MDHIFQTSDEQYEKLAAYAAQRGQTPESLFQEWVKAVTRDTDKLPVTRKKKTASNERESLNSPLLQVAGIFSIGEPGWADRHDEYLGEILLENHADK